MSEGPVTIVNGCPVSSVSSHPAETGVVRTFEQTDGGKIGKKLDEFKMENFEEAKAMIKANFKQVKEQTKK